MHLHTLCLIHVHDRLHICVYPFITMNRKKDATRKWYLVNHFNVGCDEIRDSLNAVSEVCAEVLFSALKAWSNSSMAVILYRYKQRVQHIHSIDDSSRNSSIPKVPRSILVHIQQPGSQMHPTCIGELLSFRHSVYSGQCSLWKMGDCRNLTDHPLLGNSSWAGWIS